MSFSTDTRTHIVLLSGGLASFIAGFRVKQKYQDENIRFWFFDTLIEDSDLYRFLSDCEDKLGTKIERYKDGRNPWGVFNDKRFIGNSRVDVCSRLLKRELLEKKLNQIHYKDEIVLYFGLEWSENQRIESVRRGWASKGYKVDFPLTWDPILFYCDIKNKVIENGIEIPRLYNLGFPHNNCGGACVKAGIKQWALLWKIFPERYRWHEGQEQQIRKRLGKNISILRNRKYGKTRPMTLRLLSWRLRNFRRDNGSIDGYLNQLPDNWPCSCFASDDQ